MGTWGRASTEKMVKWGLQKKALLAKPPCLLDIHEVIMLKTNYHVIFVSFFITASWMTVAITWLGNHVD